MLIGAVISALYARDRPASDEAYTVPMASGLIAGESLLGVAVALMAAAGFLQ